MILSEEQRAQVTAAVTAAETGTDGEIVTVIAAQSDPYRDVPLQYAVLAMLLVLALAAGWQGALDLLLWPVHHGWAAPELRESLIALLLLQTIVFLIVRYAVAWAPLKLAFTPRATKRRRVRRRAIELFRLAAEQRTAARVGVLLYLSTGERMAEIVADEALHGKVTPETWGAAMAALVHEVRAGRIADGMVAAVGQVGAIVAEHFPKTAEDVNELPDRLIEL